MRYIALVPVFAALVLQGCSLGPVLPGGCDQLAMSEGRQRACESGLAPRWAKKPAVSAAEEPQPQCRRTIGGVECYAPPAK
jgi:hypothetical protein